MLLLSVFKYCLIYGERSGPSHLGHEIATIIFTLQPQRAIVIAQLFNQWET